MTTVLLGLLAVVGGAVLVSVLRITEHLVEDDIKVWLPYAARRAIDQAVELLPPELHEAYREEWLAELAALEGQRIRALIFARGCLRAARREALELQPLLAPARSLTRDNDELAESSWWRRFDGYMTKLMVEFAAKVVTNKSVGNRLTAVERLRRFETRARVLHHVAVALTTVATALTLVAAVETLGELLR